MYAHARMSRPRDGLLLAAALASGAAALAYELLWTRLLALSLGSEVVGILAGLAGYFGGLALGAAVFHDRARRVADPARLFAGLELAAAAFALVSPLLLHALAHSLPRWLGPVAAAGGPAALAASTAVAALVLVPGAAPLGASLAALVEARRRGCPEDQEGRGVGRVYAANTLGATLGALAAVHLLFPALGYAWGAAVAAAVGGLSALAALRWARGRDLAAAPPSAAPAVDTARDPDPDLLKEPWLLYLLSFGLGVTGVGLQVVGVRVLGQHLENTIYTFAHMLAAYLVASSLGAFLYQRLAARALAGAPGRVTAALLWLLGVLVVPAALALHASPGLLDALAPDGSSTPPTAFAAELLAAAVVFVPAALLMGAALSHVIGLVAATGRGIGRVYAINSLGCAAAPFVFGLWAIPRLGYADALYLVLYVYLALFGLFGWFRRFSPALLIGGVLVGVALTATGPRSLALVEVGEGWTRIREWQTLHGLVAVSERPSPQPGLPGLRRLQLGNKFRMGGAVGFGEQRLGQLCALLSRASGPEGPVPSALYLGIGTGATMGGALAVPHAAAEGVELVPEILEALPLFSAINNGLRIAPDKGDAGPGTRHPEAALHAADARRWLAASPSTYDLIVADLFHPGLDGASALFAREHFEAGREHLRPGGLMCQWIPLYQLDTDDVQTIARTFLDVFPETHAFVGLYSATNPALALVGRAPDPAAPALRLDVPRLAASFTNLTLTGPRDLLASYLLGPAELAAWAGDGPRNTDLDPVIAFHAADVAYRDDRGVGARNLAALLDRAVPAPASLLAGAGADALVRAAGPHTEAARHYLRGEIARGASADVAAMSWETAEHFVRAYEADPEFPPARGALYTLARANPGVAAKLLPRMLARTPDERRVYEAYLLHLRDRDPGEYARLRAEAEQKFPGAALP